MVHLIRAIVTLSLVRCRPRPTSFKLYLRLCLVSFMWFLQWSWFTNFLTRTTSSTVSLSLKKGPGDLNTKWENLCRSSFSFSGSFSVQRSLSDWESSFSHSYHHLYGEAFSYLWRGTGVHSNCSQCLMTLLSCFLFYNNKLCLLAASTPSQRGVHMYSGVYFTWI